MKKIMVIILVICMFGLVSPATADREPPTTGTQINIFVPEQSFPAGEPFYIRHGWTIGPVNTEVLGNYDFLLIIEGVPVDTGIRYVIVDPGGDSARITRIYNFPQGLPEGAYTLYGFWYLPCQSGIHPDTCTGPNQPVNQGTQTVLLTITP